MVTYTHLQELIEQLPEGETKAEFETVLAKVKKDFEAADFKLHRTIKDKAIMINLLNASIEDLKKHQTIIEQNNEHLSQRKEEIELKNQQLSYQKCLLEEKSNLLNENLEKLERSYKELEQFSYIASHDLKSPLRTISNFAQLLQKRYQGQLDEQADEFINFIVAGTNNMNCVINDLLEYSRVGVKEKDFTYANLNDLLEMVQFNLSDEIQKQEAVIISADLPTLLVNKQGIIQLFQNLISNAIKFRKETVNPIIEISGIQEGDHYLIKVADNGVGMEEKFQDKAFMPFQRLNNSERPGTGMGLAICKKVALLHEGDIWFTSIKGEGTTFCFTIGPCEEKLEMVMEESLNSGR